MTRFFGTAGDALCERGMGDMRMTRFFGTAGDDSQAGTKRDDTFDYSQGGHDTLIGGGGVEDDYIFGRTFDTGDQVIGTGGTLDVVRLNGDYRAGVTLSPSQFVEVDRVELTAISTFRITLVDGVGGVDGALFFDCSSTIKLDASQVAATSIHLQTSGDRDQFIGGSGDDVVTILGTLTNLTGLDGGDGFDELDLGNPSSIHLHAYNMRNFEALNTQEGQIKTADGCVAAGATLTVRNFDGPMTFDGERETDGRFDILGFDGDDFLIGGHGSDTIGGGDGGDFVTGGHGADLLSGGTGADIFVYETVGDSRGRSFDSITDLEGSDTIDLRRIDARADKAGDQAFHLVDHFDGHAGELTLTYKHKDGFTVVSGDVDGDGKADFVVHISGDHSGFDGFVL